MIVVPDSALARGGLGFRGKGLWELTIGESLPPKPTIVVPDSALAHDEQQEEDDEGARDNEARDVRQRVHSGVHLGPQRRCMSQWLTHQALSEQGHGMVGQWGTGALLSVPAIGIRSCFVEGFLQ